MSKSDEKLYPEKFLANMNDIQNHMNDLKFRIESLAEDYFGPHFYDEAKEYVISHPFIAGAIVFIGTCSVIPVGIFLCFAIATIVFSLICFICLEGSVIVIGGLILVGVVSVITVVVVAITSALAVAFWCAQQFHNAICRRPNSRERINDLSVETRRHSPIRRRSWQAAANPIQKNGNINPDSTEGDPEIEAEDPGN